MPIFNPLNRRVKPWAHEYPSIPEQTILLEPYCDDSPQSIKRTENVYNLFTNFNYVYNNDIVDNIGNLTAAVKPHSKEDIFDYTSAGNNLIIGPLKIFMDSVLIEFPFDTTMDVKNNNSWFNISPLNQNYPGTPSSTFFGILSAYRVPNDLDNLDVRLFLALPDNYADDYIRSNCLPLKRFEFTTNGSNNIITVTDFVEAWHTAETVPTTIRNGPLVKYVRTPHWRNFVLNGGYVDSLQTTQTERLNLDTTIWSL